MRLSDIFKQKKQEEQNNDSISPNPFPTVPLCVLNKIDSIKWANFDTAYGNAEWTIPIYLKNLFGSDKELAMRATHQLWSSLCHQHAYISTAALPAYDILKLGLLELDDELKIEILDIMRGFSQCSDPTFANTERQQWEIELRQKFLDDKEIYVILTQKSDELISNFANDVLQDLSNDDH